MLAKIGTEAGRLMSGDMCGFAGTGGPVFVYDAVGCTVGEREEPTGNVRGAAVRDLTPANMYIVGGKCGVVLARSRQQRHIWMLCCVGACMRQR